MIKLNKDEKIYFFKKSDGFSNGSNQFIFKMSGKFNVSGNIMSLCGFSKEIHYDYQFFKLFQNNQSIIDASQLILPNNVRY